MAAGAETAGLTVSTAREQKVVTVNSQLTPYCLFRISTNETVPYTGKVALPQSA